MNIKALFVSLKLYFYLPSASASATNQLARSTDTHKLRAAFSGTQLRTDAPISILRIYSSQSRQIQGAGHLEQRLAARSELQSAGATSWHLPQRHRHAAGLRAEFHSQTSANGQGGRS